jgi:hypothetical protein
MQGSRPTGGTSVATDQKACAYLPAIQLQMTWAMCDIVNIAGRARQLGEHYTPGQELQFCLTRSYIVDSSNTAKLCSIRIAEQGLIRRGRAI